MADVGEAAAEFADLARVLTQVGLVELRRELDKAIKDAAKPVADEIGSAMHLRDVLPDGYADVLGPDLKVTISNRTTGSQIGVSVVGQAQAKARKLRHLDAGLLTHPVYGNREIWRTQGPEGGGMHPGWFSGPADRAAPSVRQQVLDAARRISDKATRRV
jgi:hypothetical protein